EPLVSVILPTRNRPHSLETALRSALAQHYDNIEVWVVDDGSEPPVILAAEFMEDTRVHLLRLDRAGGPAVARNLAVEHCRGELLAFLDDDDEWLPDKTTRQ